MIRAWGPGPSGSSHGNFRIDPDYHFAVEAQARAEGLVDKMRYVLVLWYGPGDVYNFQVTPSNGFWNVTYTPGPGQRGGSLLGYQSLTPFAKKGSEANLLRLEVRGSELKAYINGQLLGATNHEGLKRRPVTVQLGIWITESLPDGAGQAVARFSKFRVYYLGGP